MASGMKKAAACLAALCLLLLCGGCRKKPQETSGQAEASREGSVTSPGTAAPSAAEWLDSPYTVCREEDDGTYTLRIYASPVQYRAEDGGYRLFDNSLKEAEKEPFAYQNQAGKATVYFPKTLGFKVWLECGEERAFLSKLFYDFSDGERQEYINAYGDTVEAVVYGREDSDVALYPTPLGVQMELLVREPPASDLLFALPLTCDSPVCDNRENGVVCFGTGQAAEWVLQQPLLKQEGEPLQLCGGLWLYGDSGHYSYQARAGEVTTAYPYRLCPAFEKRTDGGLGMLPDSTAYSEWEANSYLSRAALVGRSERGDGRHYTRLRLHDFMTLSPGSILEASYHFRRLDASDEVSLKAREVESQWSSTRLLWDSQPALGDAIGAAEPEGNGWYAVEMRSFVQECLADPTGEKESQGFALCGQGEGSALIATSDNTLYPPYLELRLKGLPASFDRQRLEAGL